MTEHVTTKRGGRWTFKTFEYHAICSLSESPCAIQCEFVLRGSNRFPDVDAIEEWVEQYVATQPTTCEEFAELCADTWSIPCTCHMTSERHGPITFEASPAK